MPVKPSTSEEEYFARQEVERRRKAAEERQATVRAEERERERALHFMKCPKCGVLLEEIAFGNIYIDKCFGCEGIWLDKGELEMIQKKDVGFMDRLLTVFRQDSNTRPPE
jgi:Zn-finger nucleic acid-binding protein